MLNSGYYFESEVVDALAISQTFLEQEILNFYAGTSFTLCGERTLFCRDLQRWMYTRALPIQQEQERMRSLCAEL